MDPHIDWLPALLQNSDALFPTGAYAHSSGLEEIVRLGLVDEEAGLLLFIRQQLIPNLQNLELPYVRYAHAAGHKGDLDLLRLLSGEISACKLSREAREASLQMGQGRLNAARKIFPHPLLEAFAATDIPRHQILVYGWQMACAQVPLEATLAGCLYQTLAGSCSASLKLIRIGQEGVQRVLHRALAQSRKVIDASFKVERDEAGWFGPVLEIAAMRHERAQERLFIS